MNEQKDTSKIQTAIAVAEEQAAERVVSGFLRSVSVYLAVITALVVLVSYGAITTYYAGYFRYFGISISDINFFPSLADFVTRGSATISAILFAVVATLLGMILVNWMIKGIASIGVASEKKKGKFTWLKSINSKPVLSRVEIKIFLILVFVVLSFKLVYFDSEEMGYSSAESKNTFSSFIGNDGSRKVLIYQNGGDAILKTYDDSGWSEGYEVQSLSGKQYEQFKSR